MGGGRGAASPSPSPPHGMVLGAPSPPPEPNGMVRKCRKMHTLSKIALPGAGLQEQRLQGATVARGSVAIGKVATSLGCKSKPTIPQGGRG